MKTIEVVAAIIIENNKILATKRGYGDFQGGWEFPGGKIEHGETKEEALIREIKEELVIDIKVGKFLEKVEYNYPKFHLTMYCYICKIISGKIVLKEHEDAKWVTKDELDSIEWLPADLSLIEIIKKY